MMFLRNIKKKKIVAQQTDFDVQQSEKINQEMYRRNVELANKNKLLSLIHQLYSIAARTLDIPTLSQNFVQTIVSTMDFPFVSLCVLDDQIQHLVPLAGYCAEDPSVQLFDKAKHFPKTYQQGTSPFTKAWKTMRRGQSRHYQKAVSPLVFDAHTPLLERAPILVTLYIPLIANKKLMGVLCIGLQTTQQEMTRIQKDTIVNIVSIMSIALDKAKVYEELKLANLQLQELDQQKTEFLSIASHQLRTPLSIIKGYIELIQDGAYGSVTKKTISILNDMDQSNERLVKLVDEFLNISRIEQNRTKFVFADDSLRDLVEDVYKELHRRAQSKALALAWKPDPKEPYMVRMDAEKIRHVVFNFVDNAIKYSEKGTISILVEKKDKGLVVRVVDEGLGFNKSDEANFFQKFYRGQNVKGTNVNGTGLGIYVCKKFIESHKGHVWAHSPGLGRGAEFGFWIPYKRTKKR